MKDMEVKEIVFGLVRHVLTAGGVYLVNDGALEMTQVETLVGALMTIVGIGWSVWQKKKAGEKLTEAVAAPAVPPQV